MFGSRSLKCAVVTSVRVILLLEGHLLEGKGTAKAARDTSRCVGTSVSAALSVIHQVDCPGLWSVCFPVWIRLGQARECLENCRSRFEVSVHRVVHTRNSVALESVGFAGGWELTVTYRSKGPAVTFG